MSHDNHSHQPSRGIWYTYFGETGAAVVAFLWVVVGLIWLFSIIKWG